ncbi:unnamed protein product [Strongylus vulgaris]|uniref:Uncharacterized protein n=1 Tax=Strongylus vulgaris TaxID=40348 RepID=A0A3P7LE83_STRVU|nr:unnamed protein product [Strongylus vulgaris]
MLTHQMPDGDFLNDTVVRQKRQGTNNMCPLNNVLDDGSRILMVDVHNLRRTETANGESYDCDLEAAAQSVADSCSLTVTPEAQRPGYGENVHVIEQERSTVSNAFALNEVLFCNLNSASIGGAWYKTAMTCTIRRPRLPEW